VGDAAAQRHEGATLIEVLVAILIFSIGILALVALQAASVQSATQARYRTDASLLADDIVGQMWGDDKTTTALQANYNSPSGAKFLGWQAQVEANLPGAANHPPTIVIDSDNRATVTVQWQAPGESAPHRFVLVTQIHS
jgi:type IV pilus assembly protein PilV